MLALLAGSACTVFDKSSGIRTLIATTRDGLSLLAGNVLYDMVTRVPGRRRHEQGAGIKGPLAGMKPIDLGTNSAQLILLRQVVEPILRND
jgi:hypothetical protein